MKLKFIGATEGVTGSNHLLTIGDKTIMIDCGLYQGTQDEEKKNWEPFSYDPSKIDCLILTHSHIDHIGLVPKLYKHGFRGKIYSTPATRDFAAVFLPDSCELLEKVAIHHHIDPVYDLADVEQCLRLFEVVDYHVQNNILPDVNFTFYDAGHILGSAFIQIKAGNKSIVFSGDLGNPPVPIIKDPEFIKDVDYLVIESTYGDRTHQSSANRADDLENVIEDSFSIQGTLLIPAFAMERTQELLYEIRDLIKEHRIPQIPVYIDSPLAMKATAIYPKYIKDFDETAKKTIKNEKDLISFPGLHLVTSVEDSKALDRDVNPKIIIAGSGMSTGGRIVHHEAHYLPFAHTTLLIIGYQVKGSLGRRLLEKEKIVRIHGEDIEVNANIVSLDSYSAHADQPKLIYWISCIGAKKLKQIFLVHGETDSKNALKIKIQDELGINTTIPETNMEIDI